ncbi:MAG: hypothetical protein ABSG56_29640, partial [Bryobacteraceae bacterium]
VALGLCQDRLGAAHEFLGFHHGHRRHHSLTLFDHTLFAYASQAYRSGTFGTDWRQKIVAGETERNAASTEEADIAQPTFS